MEDIKNKKYPKFWDWEIEDNINNFRPNQHPRAVRNKGKPTKMTKTTFLSRDEKIERIGYRCATEGIVK